MTAGLVAHFYRMELPLQALAAQEETEEDFEVTFADAGDDGHPHTVTLDTLRGYDVVVAQRWNKHTGLEVWRRAAQWAKLVYELDDDVFNVTAENWQAYKLYGRPDIRDAIAHSLECADLVTVSTEPLAGVMREYNGNVAVCPNCIPGWVLGLPREQRPRPRIGWAGGASHGVDIGIAAEPVRRFLRRFPGWDFQLNGTDYRPTFRAPADRMHYVKWVQVNKDACGYYSGLDFDIGLAPVWPTTFSRAKSPVKILEYAARGIPAVATDCEAYRDVIQHGVNGFLVRDNNPHLWLSYMSGLASDDALRAKMGEAARDMARRHLIEDGWTAWADAYRGLFRA